MKDKKEYRKQERYIKEFGIMIKAEEEKLKELKDIQLWMIEDLKDM